MKQKYGTEFFRLTLIGCLLCAGAASAQTNAWTNSVSGYWEEPFWSAGVLPGINQTIVFTNAWEALAIGASTVSSHPETMQVEAVILAAPANTFNELLLNYAQFGTPLVIGKDSSAGSDALMGSLVVRTNSGVVILYSALQVNNNLTNGTERGAFSVGGVFNQGDFGQVTAGFMHIGDIGPGVYNLTNGVVSVSNAYLGGNFSGVFNQFDGAFTGDLTFINGEYSLGGGVFTSSTIEIPARSFPALPLVSGDFLQTGGTNVCQSLTVWGDIERDATAYQGHYTLNDGSLFISGPLSLQGFGAFWQSGGFQTNSGVSVTSMTGYSAAEVSSFLLSGGVMLTPELFVQGDYGQSGGTNFSTSLNFSGTLVPILDPPQLGFQPVGSFSLSGGLLSCSNATVVTDVAGFFFQTGGILQVSNLLSISGRYPSGGYGLNGGQLITRDLRLSEGGLFRHSGGVVVNSGMITFAEGGWIANTNETDLGRLVLSVGASNRVSHLALPSGVAVIRFGDSSGMTWANGATLMIEGWNGSSIGGGHHQIFFGNNSSALTAQQLSQIQFHNPGGINGTSPAKILPTGEVVPVLFLGSERISGDFVLSWLGGATLQTATNVLGPYSDIAASGPYTNHFTDARRFFRLRN